MAKEREASWEATWVVIATGASAPGIVSDTGVVTALGLLYCFFVISMNDFESSIAALVLSFV